MPELKNAKRELFAHEYIVDLNKTQAALRAGYSPKTAYAQGHRLLKKAEVIERVAELKAERLERVKKTGDDVVHELCALGFSNMRRLAHWGEQGVTLLNSDELAPADAAAVKKVRIKTRRYVEGRGDDAEEVEEVDQQIELHDKKGALDSLGKHFGIFQADKDPLRDRLAEVLAEVIGNDEPLGVKE